MRPLLILLLILQITLQQITLSVNSVNSYAGQTTNHIYQMLFTFQSEIVTAGDSVVIQYDTNWDLSSANFGDPSDFCENSCDLSQVAGSVVSSMNITLNNLIPATTNFGDPSFVIRFTVKNIKNPLQSGDYALLPDTTSAWVINQQYKISIIPNIISCSLATNETEVSSVAEYSLTVDVSSSGLEFPDSISISINYPSAWSNSAVGPVYEQPIECTSISPITTNINCAKQLQEYFKASNVLNAPTTGLFSFKVKKFINPGSIQPNTELYLSLLGPLSGEMAKCSVEISGLTSKSIPNLSFAFDQIQLSSISTLTMSFQLPAQVKLTDSIRLSIPKQFDISPLSIVASAIIELDGSGTYKSVELFIKDPSINYHEIQIFPFLGTNIANYSVVLSSIKNPIAAMTTSPITAGIYRFGHLVAQSTCCSFSFSPTAGGSVVIELEDKSVGISTQYTMIVSGISQYGFKFIDIELDGSYSLGGSTYGCLIIGSQSVASPLCTKTAANSIRISNIDQFMEFQLNSTEIRIQAVQNPVTISQLTATIKTLDENQNQMQILTGTYNLVATLISSVTIDVLDSVTYTQTQYKFNINNTNSLPPSTDITITFPQSVLLTVQSKCFIDTVQQTNSIIDIVSSTVFIPLQNAGTISAGSLLSYNITISEIINPATLAPPDSFEISLSQSGSIIEERNEGIIAKISSQKNSFGSLSIYNADLTTYTQNDYNIDITLPVDVSIVYPGIYTSAYLSIEFPDDFLVVSCLACLEISPLKLTLPLNPLTSSIGPINIRNPFEVSISTVIIASLYIDEQISISQAFSGLQSFNPHEIVFSISNQHTFLEEQTYQIINVTTPIPEIVHSLTITVPPQYQIRSFGGILVTTDYSSANINIATTSSTLDSITLTNLPFLSSISISIVGLINPPSSPGTNSWVVTFQSSTSILIAQSSTNVIFSTECNAPCRSCSSDINHCLSCYNVSGSAFPYLQSNQCVGSCSSSQFEIGNICYQCDSSCKTCQGIQNNCTSCELGSYLFLNLCVSTCPLAYYEDTALNQCIDCSSPCLLCSNTTCYYCETGSVLTSTGTCQNACPSGFYNQSNVCQACQYNCSDCVITGCLTCVNSTYLYSGKCFVECPKSLYISIGGDTCQACQTPCLSCEIYSYACKTCDTTSVSNKYLDGTSCVLNCPLDSYADEFFICRSCISPCYSCSSQTQCDSCEVNYYYYSQTKQCFQNCPQNTLPIGSTCQACVSPCLQCTGTAATCVSCIQSYFLDGTQCLTDCILPLYAIDGKCRRCAQPCANCGNLQPYLCLTCISGYYLLGTSCYLECPSGTFNSGLICGICDSGCKECSGTSSTCLSCIEGLYLYNQACISDCPDESYYRYQRQCIQCDYSICTECLSSPIECKSCAHSSLFQNVDTKECSSSCAQLYYEAVIDSINYCIKCSMPCSTCGDSYLNCSSCISTHYLLESQCLETCPQYYFQDVKNNVCEECPQKCVKCQRKQFCMQCELGLLLYKGQCYQNCPSQAPFSYQDKYCRNCELPNCLLCSEDKQKCILCENLYYYYDYQCLTACPSPESQFSPIDQYLCITTSQYALQAYAIKLEKLKHIVMPGAILFLLCLPLIVFPTSSSKLLMCVVGICLPQFLALIVELIVLLVYPEQITEMNFYDIIPFVCIAIFCVSNIILTMYMYEKMVDDYVFKQWAKEGKNERRFKILIIFCAVFNKKFIYLLFTGFSKIPITCCQVSYHIVTESFKKYHSASVILLFLVEIPLIGYSLMILALQQSHLLSYKMFFSSLDIIFVCLLSIIFHVILIVTGLKMPPPYQKYINHKISNYSLPALSQRLPDPEIEETEERNMLNHSNSNQKLKKSQQMANVEYNSVFDTNEYQDPDFFDDIPEAIDDGKFRKSNLKKKKKDNFPDLQMIQQENQDDLEQIALKKKKRKPMVKKKVGYLNNFIYWKPPEKSEDPKKMAKKKIENQIKMNEKQIFSKIKQKQSEFDALTRNDIIFHEDIHEEGYQSFSSEDYEMEDTKRALNFQFDRFIDKFQKNYAKKKHLTIQDI